MGLFSRYETLDGYVVQVTTEKAVGIVRARSGASAKSDLVWLPRSVCQDGAYLNVGDTDIACFGSIADERGLEY